MPFGIAGPIVMTGNLATTAQIKSNGTLIAKASRFEAVQITGSAADDVLLGGTGNDTLNAQAGIDKLTSGNGDDFLSMTLGAGVDTVQAGGGTDTVNISAFLPNNVVLSHGAGGSEVTIDGVLAATIADGEIFSIFAGAGDDVLEGSALGDTLNGNTGANSITGGAGNDTLGVVLDDEVDTISGGAGTDQVNVSLSDLNDTLVMAPAAGGKVTFKVGAATLASATGVESANAFGGNGNDRLTGLAGNDTLSGNGGNDTIKAGNGDDVISGGNDSDRLEGGAGNDSINGDNGDDNILGGAGADQFRFLSTIQGNDTIGDFTAADSIGIFGLSFGIAAGSAVTLISGTDPAVPPDTFGRFFLLDTDTGQLSFDFDGAGASAPSLLAILENGGTPATLAAGQITVF
jgi:Ca2+-binding RTX toxin-like protein